MSAEKIAELKALCLELATEQCKHQPSQTLSVAKEYFEWIISKLN